MSADFVHLHVHSEYSLLDGLGRVSALVNQAVKNNQSALALTDHGAMHGVIEFFRACRAREVKPIIGLEAYMTLYGRKMTDRDPYKDKSRHHLLLLAQNMTGYRNLLELSSAAQLEGYYYKPRIDADFLAQHSAGLICTTGCMAAEVPYYLNDEGQPPNEKLALDRFRWYLDVFGRDNFYVELQEHNIPALTRINKTLVDWAKTHNVGLVVTNDVHYPTAADATPHDTLLCVQTGSLVKDSNRLSFGDPGYYLKSGAEMRELFRPLADLPESAFTNTVKIAEMCAVDLEDGRYHLPDLPVDIRPPQKDYRTMLRQLTDEGLAWRYGERAQDEEIQIRKEHELNIIGRMNFDVYFLIVWDLCKFARENNIWWNVRGSGAGSIVAYSLGITMIDPLANNLIFERFLNPGRVSMPDFDLDFPDDRREEMIHYTIQKYGEDHVAQIVSFGRMKARAAIRDVGRAQGVELDAVDKIAKLIPAIPGKPVTIAKVLDPESEFYSAELKNRYQNEKMVKDLVDTARSLEGVARHASVHAAAVIISDEPLIAYVPLMRPQGSVITKSVTQFEFPVCESIGLLKVDFLGLSTLTIMRKAAELIKARHGKVYNLENIPLDDPQAFELLASGNLTGIFQVEGGGMRRLMREMQPQTLDHIIAAISLYRPGPMENIPTYIARMHGREEVAYHHPDLEPILNDTYGILVYQEQIIRIASDLAGYAPGDADMIRKAVAKKKKDLMEKHHLQFTAGAMARGYSQAVCEKIWGDIEYFARYGFNKAHAADYAVITVQTAYLKARYPVEYMAALLTVEHNDTAKVGRLVEECRSMGIEVLPPDVNRSGNSFLIEEADEGATIRFGLGAVKNVGEGPIEAILKARRDGPFGDIDDFCQRVDLRKVGKRALESLIKAGACKQFATRPQLLAIIDRMLRLSSSTHKAADQGQLSMFDLVELDVPVTGSILHPLPEVEDVERRVKLGWEKELVGAYISEHPLQHRMADIKAAVTCLCGDLEALQHGRRVTVAGLITRLRYTTTKKGDSMAFVEIEDTQGSLEVIVFPRTFDAYKHLLNTEDLIVVSGKVDGKDEDNPKILADSISNELISHHPAGEDDLSAEPAAETVVAPAESGYHSQHDHHGPPPIPVEPEQPPEDLWVSGRKLKLDLVVPRSGDAGQDVQILRQIYQLLSNNRGDSPFTFLIPNADRSLQVEVAYEFGIRYNSKLKQQLTDLGVVIYPRN